MSEENENKTDASVWIRRIANIAISAVIGYIGTFLAVRYILQTVMSDFGTTYTVLTVIMIGCAIGIWLDHEKVLNSKILPH